jgi:hypothetical protein
VSPRKIAKIREAVLSAKSSDGKPVRYSEKIKKSVLEMLRSGLRPGVVAKLTGLNTPVIFKWAHRYGDEFRAVKVSSKLPRAEVSTIHVVMPQGIRIECSSVLCLREILEIFK